ncbi:hypothetical protein [Hymenobacter terrenus]|uniref:hypothetical protein n=1 Tax=Hymenobacter terrenus TaxID=1629124 RepID=UPI00061975F0|nr:hypothetical protein [Hymenobacter terrenus]
MATYHQHGKPTVDFLTSGSSSLYAFKAVQGPKNARPVVWFQTTEFVQNITVSWDSTSSKGRK